MSTPSLRILIVEDEHLQRLSIEKMFNKFGYHRIAPVGSFDELLAMLDRADEPFDLVVINTALVPETDRHFETFCIQCPYVRNALVYEGRPRFVAANDEREGGVFKRIPGVPYTRIIENLMSSIDPCPKEAAACSALSGRSNT